MNQAMMDAMALEGGDQAYQDNPEAPIAVQDQSGEMVEMDPSALAAEGLGYAYRDMVVNGPTRPLHSQRDLERGLDQNKMTKAQLKEQKMNEEEGYPSNLDEARKVKDLERKVQNIETGIGQILSHLSGQSSQARTPPSGPTGGTPASPAEVPTQTPVPSATVSPPSPPLTGSSGSNEPANRQPQLRQVTLSDGRTVSVPQTSPPAMSLGPVADALPPETPEVVAWAGPTSEDGVDDWDDDPIAVVPEPEPEAPKADPKLARVQQLVQDVNGFMQTNDVHRYWRRHVGQKVHRHVGYAGWPTKLQTEFDVRFKGFLQDPQFVTSVCRKVIDMELGHALGAKWVAGFLVLTAGFTAFTLCGLDG